MHTHARTTLRRRYLREWSKARLESLCCAAACSPLATALRTSASDATGVCDACWAIVCSLCSYSGEVVAYGDRALSYGCSGGGGDAAK
jgi:hypothetical protein